MRILLATGIYPPQIGGPSFYAESLKRAFEAQGERVRVATYGWIGYLPTGVRHLVFFFLYLPHAFSADVVIALDTFSVGLPAAWWRLLFRRKFVVRTGGDFLWEGYVERTGEKVLLSDFYREKRKLSLKERCIFRLTRFVLKVADRVVFSTSYQKELWVPVYGILDEKTVQIENYSGPKKKGAAAEKKVFVGYTRELRWKNVDMLKRVFERIQKKYPEAILKTGSVSREQFLKELEQCYAVVLVSLGDISPNMVFEALQYGKPVVVTSENGLVDRLGDVVLYADPLDEEDIREKLELLLDDEKYTDYKTRAEQFNFVHTYEDIAEEFLTVIQTL